MAKPLTTSQLQQIAELLEEDFHVIQFTNNGWTIAHPLVERLELSLFDCTFNWKGEDPGYRGIFYLHDEETIGGIYGRG